MPKKRGNSFLSGALLPVPRISASGSENAFTGNSFQQISHNPVPTNVYVWKGIGNWKTAKDRQMFICRSFAMVKQAKNGPDAFFR